MLPLRNSSYRVWRVGSLELPLENDPVGVSQWKAEENVGTTDPTTSQDHREKDGCLVKSSIPWSLVSQLLGKLQETPVCQLLRLWQQSFFCCFTSNPYRVDSLIKFQGELQRETFQSCQAWHPSAWDQDHWRTGCLCKCKGECWGSICFSTALLFSGINRLISFLAFFCLVAEGKKTFCNIL